MCAYQIGHSQIGAKQKGAKYFFFKALHGVDK